VAEEEAKGPEELPTEGDELEAGYEAAVEEAADEAEPLADAIEDAEQDADLVDVVDAPAGTELGDEDLAEPEAFDVDDEEAEELEEGSTADVDVDQLEEAEEDAAEADSPKPVAKDRPTRKSGAATASATASVKVPEKKNRPTRTRAAATALDAPKKTTLGQFISQVIQELKKVVWPSSGQLWQYFIVVLVFVLFMIAFIGVLDYLFGMLVMWLFK
jgi:preprotein translocase subunit SecE